MASIRWVWLRWMGLGLALLGAPAVAAEPWRQASSAHFVIYAQDSAVGLRDYAERLERFDKALRVIVNTGDEPAGDANRLTIYVVANSAAVQRLMGRGAGGVAGFYRGRAGSSVAVTSREKGGDLDLKPQIVLLHEYAHHFMLRNYPAAYPAWYREGFAEFYSTVRFDPDGAVMIGLPANHRVYDLASVGDPKLALMLAPGTGKAVGQSELYGYGWLLTHYLTFNMPRRGQLTRYLEAIGRGTPAAKAATDAFGDIGALERELRGYLLRRKMVGARLEPEKLPIGPVTLRELSAGEQAIMPTLMRSRVGVDERTAKSVAAAARVAAAPFPNDAAVQVALAEAEYDVGDLAAAERAADRALAADPKALRAWCYKAMVALRQAGDAKDRARLALIKEARGFIVKANRIDPDHPEPLILFYDSFAVAEEAPNANAITGLTTAHLLAPEDDGLRLSLASRLIQDERNAEAKALLTPIAYSPHGGGLRDAAQAMLAKLEPPAGAPAGTISTAAAPR